MTIRLVAVDEHVLLRLGLNRVVATVPDITLVGEAGSAAEAERVVAETAANVVTIDASLADTDGISLARRLRAASPDLGVVLLSAVSDDNLLYRALDAGPLGVRDQGRPDLLGARRDPPRRGRPALVHRAGPVLRAVAPPRPDRAAQPARAGGADR